MRTSGRYLRLPADAPAERLPWWGAAPIIAALAALLWLALVVAAEWGWPS